MNSNSSEKASLGPPYSLDEPLSTWRLISQVLSSALFAQSDRLRLTSSMELRGKDYLLFEMRNSTTTASDGTIVEVIIKKIDSRTWEGSSKEASDVIKRHVRQSMYTKSLGELLEEEGVFLTRL